MIEIKRPVILFREWTDISLNEYMYNNHWSTNYQPQKDSLMHTVVTVDDSSIKLIGSFEYSLLSHDKSSNTKNTCESHAQNISLFEKFKIKQN